MSAGGIRLIVGGGTGRLAGLKKLFGCSASARPWKPSASRDCRRASSGFSGRGSAGGVVVARAAVRWSSGLTGGAGRAGR